jgi:hypothetical protein
VQLRRSVRRFDISPAVVPPSNPTFSISAPFNFVAASSASTSSRPSFRRPINVFHIGALQLRRSVRRFDIFPADRSSSNPVVIFPIAMTPLQLFPII